MLTSSIIVITESSASIQEVFSYKSFPPFTKEDNKMYDCQNSFSNSWQNLDGV